MNCTLPGRYFYSRKTVNLPKSRRWINWSERPFIRSFAPRVQFPASRHTRFLFGTEFSLQSFADRLTERFGLWIGGFTFNRTVWRVYELCAKDLFFFVFSIFWWFGWTVLCDFWNEINKVGCDIWLFFVIFRKNCATV